MTAELNQKSVLGMILLTIVSFGIYPVFYFWDMKKTTDALPVQKKMDSNLLNLYFVLVSIQIPLGFMANVIELQEGLLFAACGLNISVFLVVLLVLFDLEEILTEYFKTSKATDPAFKGFLPALFTFIFGIFYVQYKINRALENTEYRESHKILFPLTVRCPGCRGKIVVGKPGSWRCPVCKDINSTDPRGRVYSKAGTNVLKSPPEKSGTGEGGQEE